MQYQFGRPVVAGYGSDDVRTEHNALVLSR